MRIVRAGWLFLEALIAIYFAKSILFFLPFKKIRMLIHRFSNREDLKNFDVLEGKRVSAAVLRARRFVLWKRSYCLVNALALHWMLTRRGIQSSIHLGVSKKDSELTAHAWIESDGTPLIGAELKSQFTLIASLK